MGITVLFSPHAAGATYYVSPTGDDSAKGTNILTAWKKIQKAANTVVAGDIVRVLPGDYLERITETTDGTPTKPIIYLADPEAKVQGGFLLNGSDYVKIIGFQITHQDFPTNFTCAAVSMIGVTGSEVLDCHLHHLNSYGVEIIGCRQILVRDCNIHHTAFQLYPASTVAIVTRNTPSADISIEYNRVSYVSDYVNTSSGTGGGTTNTVVRNNRFGPTATETVAHVDGVQPNGPSPNGLFEANYCVDNNNSDNHVYLNQILDAPRWILRGNVTVRSKGFLDLSRANKNAFYHNSFVNNVDYYNSQFQMHVYNGSTNNVARNNIWYRSTQADFGIVYAIDTNGAIDHDYDLSYLNGRLNQPHLIKADPLFTSLAGFDYSLQANSPAINAGGPITTAVGPGNSSTTLIVLNAAAFWVGDTIGIADSQPVSISSIDLDANTIILSEPRTWAAGAPLYWNARKDIGAYPHLPAGFGFEVALTNSNFIIATNTAALFAVVDNPEAVRMVEFRVDGVPIGIDNTNPFSAGFDATGMTGFHTVEAIAYARYAADVPVKRQAITATISPTGRPQPPKNLLATPN